MSTAEERELDEIFGPVSERPNLELVTHPRESDLPTAGEMNAEQTTDAVYRLFEDTSTFPRFPWGELDQVAGLMCPEDLWLIAGRTGNGKSLFCLNLFDRLVEAGRRILYVGLEQSPKMLRVKWACLRAGVPPRVILAARPEEKLSASYEAARDLVANELKWQKSVDMKLRAHFSATRFVNRAGLQAWVEWAVGMDCELVIVDHIDRMQHGDGTNSFAELSATVRLAKELAVHHKIVMLVASQVGRPKEALQRFMPPMVSELRGAGTKEEEADAILAVYRPLKPGTTEKQMKLVRQGLLDEHQIYQSNRMGVRVLKHRLDGEVTRTALLEVEKGRLADTPTRQFGRYDV